MNSLYLLLSILLLLLISLIIKKIFRKINKKKINYNLEKHGIEIIKNLLNKNDVNIIKNLIDNNQDMEVKYNLLNNTNIKNFILNKFGPDYELHDYISILKKDQLNACHRDYNTILYNKNQKYISYTLIIYFENIEKCLDIIPETHNSLYANILNITDFTTSIKNCMSGDALLFNSGLIHSGSLNKKKNNLRIQLKISHKYDKQNSLNFYEQYYKKLNKENKNEKWINQLQKHITCSFPLLDILTYKYDDNIKREENTNNNFLSKYVYKKFENI